MKWIESNSTHSVCDSSNVYLNLICLSCRPLNVNSECEHDQLKWNCRDLEIETHLLIYAKLVSCILLIFTTHILCVYYMHLYLYIQSLFIDIEIQGCLPLWNILFVGSDGTVGGTFKGVVYGIIFACLLSCLLFSLTQLISESINYGFC